MLVKLVSKNSYAVFSNAAEQADELYMFAIVNWTAKLGSKLQWLNIFIYDAKHLRFENNALKKLFPQKPLWRVRC